MGSHQSGEGFTAGDINWANNITLVIAARYDQGNFTGDFSGNQIFIAKPDDDPKQRPSHVVDGVTGYGYMGGAGVFGVGCADDGPDGPGTGAGTGGFGVIGLGGSGNLNKNAATVAWGDVIHERFDPGAGVLGVGGFWAGGNQSDVEGGRRDRDGKGGAGVVGVAGGEHGRPGWPYFDQFRGVGVFGLSAVGGAGMIGVAESDGYQFDRDKYDESQGMGVYGASKVAGVFGRGGTGVVAKGTETGIYATGQTAVVAQGSATGSIAVVANGDWTGVRAQGGFAGIEAQGGFGGRGGIFSSGYYEGAPVAQIGIQPLEMELTDAEFSTIR
jgi:hypothetical protein